MVPNKSLDEIEIIANLLRDFSLKHGDVFDTRALRLTVSKLQARYSSEGIGLLTKTLPKLGKALDKAIAGEDPVNAVKLGFDPLPDSNLPRFLGEFFTRILSSSGVLLSDPCVMSVAVIRQVCFVFYKYKLPSTPEQNKEVIDKFVRTEEDLCSLVPRFQFIKHWIETHSVDSRQLYIKTDVDIIRRAQRLLWELLRSFDPYNIVPSHGPGSVATKQQTWQKYVWTNIAERLTHEYPIDQYFVAGMDHVVDAYRSFDKLSNKDLPAKVILVPKDSRGPRLISAEPVDFQWIQQGIRRALTEYIEDHPLTREEMFFTDQEPNRRGALLGSMTQGYATLDLQEASDRVSLDLVRLLFPQPLLRCLEASRTQATVLPDGRILQLRKFAPMGSALCFPIMALTIWALLKVGLADSSDTVESLKDLDGKLHVYGDDVIVPTAKAERAIELLELFGLRVNRSKSCTKGLFRESCGMDAFRGEDVTPVRLKTVWSSFPSADSYVAFIDYINEFHRRGLLSVHEYLVDRMEHIYGPIPSKALRLSVPSIHGNAVDDSRIPRRWDPNLQRFEYRVWDIRSRKVQKELDGWTMLLRYFTEAHKGDYDEHGISTSPLVSDCALDDGFSTRPFKVRSYTRRRASMLARRWR
jgi:hypothetical protein